MRDSLPIPDVPQGVLPHGSAVGALFVSFMGWVPAIVAILPAVYYLLLIYESKTVQGFLQRRRERRKSK